MTRVLRHRGPDGEGYFEDGHANLGHRRLSIIDLNTGDQPMSNEDGSVWITFNGEVYNYLKLREDLQRRGHRFRSRSDTESIVHLYEEYGSDCVRHLRGQFAFALWDVSRKQLLLARDRLGQKPLYYCHLGTRVLFGSELTSLLQDPTVSKEFDLVGLDAYLTYGFVPEPLTILRQVRKLPPAHTMVVTAADAKTDTYWESGFGSLLDIKEDEALEQLDALLEEATRLRMIADVPLGAFLSGGIDSSLVVAYMSRVSKQPIKTFSIGFDDDAYDERPYARQVATRFGTDHREYVVHPEAAKVLPQMVQCFGEPFADSSALPAYYVARMARQEVTVALNGDGGDESFFGYHRYRGMVQLGHYRRLPRWLRRCAVVSANLLEKTSFGELETVGRIRRWDGIADMGDGEVYEKTFSKPSSQRMALYHDDVRAYLSNHSGAGVIAACYHECPSASTVNRVMYADQRVYLPADLLVKVDRMTMCHGLEGRSPFLDHKVVEFAARLPERIKFKRGTQKYLLKQLLRRHFPSSFVNRRKMGFGVPIAKWFRTSLRSLLEDCLHNSSVVQAGLLDQKALHQLVEEHVSGASDHQGFLWAFVNLELWHRSTMSPTASL